MNKEQVYNILSKRAAQQSKQSDPIKQFLRRVLGPSVMDYRNGADILRLHLQDRRKKILKLLNGIIPLRKPVPRAANSDHVKQACLWGLMKTAEYREHRGMGNVKMPKLTLEQTQGSTDLDEEGSDVDNTIATAEQPQSIQPQGQATGTTSVPAKTLPKKTPKDQTKTPEKPGTPDPWSRWGGKLIGGGLGGLGLYGIMSIFTSSPILRALAFLFGAGAGGYMGHTYDAYKASRVPSSKVPGNKHTT